MNFSLNTRRALIWATNPYPSNGQTSKVKCAPLRKQAKIDEDILIKEIRNAKTKGTGAMGEKITWDVCERLGKNPRKPIKFDNHLRPDIETDDAIIEVKTRSWCTTGTVGEKLFAVPYKYCDLPELYGKPLWIVCVAYQEWEAKAGNTVVFDDIKSPSTNQQKMLDLWKSMDIHYVKFSDLVRELPDR